MTRYWNLRKLECWPTNLIDYMYSWGGLTVAGMEEMRRTEGAQALEERLAALVYGRAEGEGANGQAIVRQDVLRWLLRPRRGEATNGGLTKAMERWIQRSGVKGTVADWVWSWVNEEQHSERMSCDAQRVMPGGVKELTWRGRAERGDCEWERYGAKVLRAVLRLSGAATLRREQWPRVRAAVRGAAAGRGSEDLLRAALWHLAATAGLEVEGQGVDTTVSGEWESKEWWTRVEQRAESGMRDGVRGVATVVLGWSAARGPSAGDEVAVHWCAGWGSGVEKALQERGYKVVAVEIAEGRVSADVLWAQLDLTKVSWRWWREEVARLTGVTVGQMKRHWGGVPCDSFASSDPSNKRTRDGRLREYNYREHAQGAGHRMSAHPAGSWRGQVARDGGKLAWGYARVM